MLRRAGYDATRSEDDAARAARRRATWSGEPRPDQAPMRASETTLEERVAPLRELAETAGALSGEPWPGYGREDMPGKVIRAGRR